MTRIEISPLQRWQDYLREGVLAYQYSPDADRAVFYPRVLCPFGGKAPLEWRVSSGRGSIYSISLVHNPKADPHAVALIDLDEGFRMMAIVEGAAGTPDEIGRRVVVRIGQPTAEGAAPTATFRWENAE
ncbi:hypothetical protein GCM10011385_21550 [Nitratireductor aestuarii]|uniref:ChsH2 C-terminal OB-fold domain-containing protein n=1 Tax=Nitratireductor aestuarii TaxID=1735103 RepID=A0A916RU14_9HYPH|nr:OB-fold domain-containing protein [Nitratireductor aestuarii]GGA67336.1 hypothetical protein GCM10011385_21550 [Nitratireductor aestuarii]